MKTFHHFDLLLNIHKLFDAWKKEKILAVDIVEGSQNNNNRKSVAAMAHEAIFSHLE